MWCRQERNQTKEDISESPIKNTVRNVAEDIQNENPDWPAVWWRLQFDAIPDPNDKNKYTIKAYWRDISVEVTSPPAKLAEGSWSKMTEEQKNKLKNMMLFSQVRILWISWWNPEIKADMTKWNISNLKLPLKEWLHMTAFLGELLDKYHHKWNEYPRFQYSWRTLKMLEATWSTVKWRFWWKDDVYDKWIYFSDSGLDTQVLSRKKFEEKMPTLFKANHWEDFIKFLNDWITDEQNVSIRKKK